MPTGDNASDDELHTMINEVSQDFRGWTRINVTHLTDEAVTRMATCMREAGG